jgi:SNF2 family DNA or RNA helicase
LSDIRKFTPHLRVVLAYANKRDEALDTPADIYVINVDGVVDLLKRPPSFWKKFSTIIVDESTAFKHRTSRRSAALAKIIKHFEWRRLLSGTPTSNGICDIWHQMFLVDDGQRLGKDFYKFQQAACIGEKHEVRGKGSEDEEDGEWGERLAKSRVQAVKTITKWVDRPDIEDVVADMIKDVVVRHRFEDCVDIPANHTYPRFIQLSPRHLKLYQELKRKTILQLEEAQVTALNGASLYTKLLQVASGAVYNDEGEYSHVNSERYELILELVAERTHSIVFYLWDHQLNELVKEAKRQKISHVVWNSEKPGIAEAFQAGQYEVMFAHPASAGHGLTLTRATSTIWASPTVNLEWFLQGKKRIHRIGQTQKTETIVILAEGTIDTDVYAALERKDVKMTNLLQGLK